MAHVTTANDLIVALSRRFRPPAYAFLTQVRNGTGWSKVTRTADALAFSLWPSRGLELMGFEVKVARSDWMSELARPDKAEAIAQYCDRWWIVVPDKEFVRKGECPPTWGVMALNGKGLEVQREAPKLKAKPLDKSQLAAILRKVNEAMVPAQEVAAMVEYQVSKQHAGQVSDAAFLREELKSLKGRIAAFEQASGVKIESDWRHEPAQIGEAVRLVLSGKATDVKHQMQQLLGRAEHIVTSIKQELEIDHA